MSKFRNEQNQLLTRGLFVEQTLVDNQDRCLYSLSRVEKTRGGKTFPSLYKLYMDENDILEHDFATKYFEGWEHWQMICNSWWMKPLIAKWREELEVRKVSDALKIIEAEAIANTKYSYGAAVYLSKKGWKDKPVEKVEKKASVGRPSKIKIAEEAARIAMEEHDVDEDLKRLGITVN